MTILSSRASHSVLDRLRASATTLPATQTDIPSDANPLHTALLSDSTKQSAHIQECLYRACATVTTFKIQDPDPNAVDSGNVLGLRFEVGNMGKFIRPYYVMLNKPFPSSNLLHVHRHTVPPCIPLAVLAARYLPSPKSQEVVKEKKQDLVRFVRSLRREIVGYHNRIAVIKSLRKAFALDEKSSKKGKGREKVIGDISAADAEAKQVRIEWIDGRIGRCVVGDKGEVTKCVIIGEDGRDRETERRIMGGDKRMERIAERLKEGIY